MPDRGVVLDANILIRAVLGERVRHLIECHCEKMAFFVPQAAYDEAVNHLHELVKKGAAILRNGALSAGGDECTVAAFEFADAGGR